MVKEFYSQFGFVKISEDVEGNAVLEYRIPDRPEKRNHVIEVEI